MGIRDTLYQIDGQGYGTYRQIRGIHRLDEFQLSVDKVQVDPYAPASLMRVILPSGVVDLPNELIDDPAGRVATSDFLTRRFAQAIRKGSSVSIGTPGQQVLQRSSVVIGQNTVEARIAVDLPAAGRRIRGRQAAQILTEELPHIVANSLKFQHLNAQALADHVSLYRDQEYLRGVLAANRLVGFVGDGSILPRRSGDSDIPLADEAVPFFAPETLRVSFQLPSGRTVTGMGIHEGVTVIVGGGYHGKSTLLGALSRGVYPHISGDGREWVITRADAVNIRAEDGRAVTGVDISPYISGLPSGADTTSFSTTNASGSTSQAANLVEALEAGATALLIDEDTSATNFMIRDDRMKQLVAAEKEPIKPFIDRVRPLLTERGVSTVLVAGGSGAFFEVADHVIALDEYVPVDVTSRAHDIAGKHPVADNSRRLASVFSHEAPQRIPRTDGMGAQGKKKPATARGRSVIQFGRERVELSAVAQLIDPAQTAAIAFAMDRIAEQLDGQVSLVEAITALLAKVENEGLEVLSPHHGHPGHLALPRRQEIHSAINRYRHLQLSS